MEKPQPRKLRKGVRMFYDLSFLRPETKKLLDSFPPDARERILFMAGVAWDEAERRLGKAPEQPPTDAERQPATV